MSKKVYLIDIQRRTMFKEWFSLRRGENPKNQYQKTDLSALLDGLFDC